MVDRAGPADEMLEFVVELFLEGGVETVMVIGRAQLVERVHERFCHENTAIRAEMALGIRKVVRFHQASPPGIAAGHCRPQIRFATRHFT